LTDEINKRAIIVSDPEKHGFYNIVRYGGRKNESPKNVPRRKKKNRIHKGGEKGRYPDCRENKYRQTSFLRGRGGEGLPENATH